MNEKKKLGRPALPPAERLSASLVVPITPLLRERLQAAADAACVTLAAYVRAALARALEESC